MNTRLILIISFSALYGFFEGFMSRRQKDKGEISKSGDKGSIWLLTAAIGIGYWFAFGFAFLRIGRISYQDIFLIIGAILAVIGLIIRIGSILTLKKYFTYTVTKIENHRLIDTGLYKNIRHPGYLGQLIIFLGISTSLSNWVSITGMMIPVLSAYIFRIAIEEKFLVNQMGQAYIDYQKRTKKLIPGIF